MNRSDLARAIAHEVPDLSAATAELVLGALPRIMHTELSSKGEFQLHGLGRFAVKDVAAKPARTGHNPKTGAEIQIAAKPAGKRIAFRAGKAMQVV